MPLIELEISNRVATLTLCRPEALNAINQALLREFEEALRQMQEASDVVVLVTQGSGRAFSAGSDLKELAECSPQQAAAFEYAHGQVFAHWRSFRRLPLQHGEDTFWEEDSSWVSTTISASLHKVPASVCQR